MPYLRIAACVLCAVYVPTACTLCRVLGTWLPPLCKSQCIPTHRLTRTITYWHHQFVDLESETVISELPKSRDAWNKWLPVLWNNLTLKSSNAPQSLLFVRPTDLICVPLWFVPGNSGHVHFWASCDLNGWPPGKTGRCELGSVHRCGLESVTDRLYSCYRVDTDVKWIKYITVNIRIDRGAWDTWIARVVCVCVCASSNIGSNLAHLAHVMLNNSVCNYMSAGRHHTVWITVRDRRWFSYQYLSVYSEDKTCFFHGSRDRSMEISICQCHFSNRSINQSIRTFAIAATIIFSVTPSKYCHNWTGFGFKSVYELSYRLMSR